MKGGRLGELSSVRDWAAKEIHMVRGKVGVDGEG